MLFWTLTRGGRGPHPIVWLCLCAALVIALPGCGGCIKSPTTGQKKSQEELERELMEKKKKQEKPKPDFEPGRLQIMPLDSMARPNEQEDEDGERVLVNRAVSTNPVKPGHWISATQEMKANNFDIQANLVTQVVDQRQNPLLIERTPFAIEMSRPASLPKGQLKNFETIYSIPRVGMRRSVMAGVMGDPTPPLKQVWLSSEFRARRGGRLLNSPPSEKVTLMPAFQYFLVVLSEQPDSYGFLRSSPAVDPPDDELNVGEAIRYYQVVAPAMDRNVPVPSHPLTWTSIAYVVWDGVNPKLMTPDQEDAMLDWLHWGGQLIVSGPRSLDLLRGSFLEPYLPASSGETRPLSAEDFAAIDEKFSLRSKKEKRKLNLSIIADKPPLGVSLKLHESASFMPFTGELVAERNVGVGRVVVTAFSANDPQVVNKWKSFDNFLNNVLLRLPPRIYRETPDLTAVAQWTAGYNGLERDARITSGLRYFARDIGMFENAKREVILDKDRPGVFEIDPRFAGYEQTAESGVGSWNDFSGAANVARDSLREAAGISIPEAKFVWQVMAVYLIALVPVNWGFFWVIRRVEWAWLAAPVIAIAGAIAVVKLAQLDIGFARSLTQIAVLESHADYPRAHLTRYAALYTSLSTSYDVTFEDTSALAQPFSDSPDFEMALHDRVKTVEYRRDRDVSLSGFTVESNQTDMMHCEQMVPLNGAVSLGGNAVAGWKVSNGTLVELRDAAAVWRDEEGVLQTAWMGDVATNTSATLEFAHAPEEGRLIPQWDASEAMSHGGGEGEIHLGRMADLATERLRVLPGDMRLIAWTDQEMPGIAFDPDASQNKRRTLILIHLRR
ncbi:MAG: hypothetical protein KDA62_09300, partial [Planctomycetales bacterium]|nr:hypothetical protein [Planctomycetales bacterium]